MKQATNITLLVMVLSIPFALSQTRKAIPAGRYEALSGVKATRSTKGSEVNISKDSLSLFWNDVVKHLPQGRSENFYYSSGLLDPNVKELLNSKGVMESTSVNSRVNILLSDDFGRDNNLYKKIKNKGSLIILKDKRSLKEVILAFGSYDVLMYQTEADSNYYLFKLK